MATLRDRISQVFSAVDNVADPRFVNNKALHLPAPTWLAWNNTAARRRAVHKCRVQSNSRKSEAWRQSGAAEVLRAAAELCGLL